MTKPECKLVGIDGDVLSNHGFIETVIHWFTTPEELRALATKMEIQQLSAKPGDKTRAKVIRLAHGQSVTLEVHYDQQ